MVTVFWGVLRGLQGRLVWLDWLQRHSLQLRLLLLHEL